MFNPSRLAIGRQRRGMKVKELAARTGLSVNSISDYEKNNTVPSPESLQAIAAALEFPISFFCGDSLPSPPAKNQANFRASTKMTAPQRDAVLAAESFALCLNEWLLQRFELPGQNLPDFEEVDPEAAADILRRHWNMGHNPIPNMVHLLESKGVRVFSLAEDCSEVDAFSRFHKGLPFIYLNTRKTAERSRFDAAHELGHLVLHKNSTKETRIKEKEANAFAAAFLMPRSTLTSSVPSAVITLSALLQLKQYWRVSVAALTHRIIGLGLLSEWHERTLWIQISQSGYRTHEPEGLTRENSQVFQKIFSQVKLADAASDLNIPLDELEKLVFGLTLRPIQGQGRPGTFENHPKPVFRVVAPQGSINKPPFTPGR